jgi:hypothetical protein
VLGREDIPVEAIVDLASRIASQQAAQSTAPQPGGMATATAEKQ